MEFGRVNPSLQRSLTLLLLAVWMNASPVCGVSGDPCHLFGCPETHVCQATDGSLEFQCLCQSGYNCTNNPCGNNPCVFGNGRCTEDGTGFMCSCDSECELRLTCASKPCHNNASCLDTLNGYFCDCPPGYTGERCDTAANKCEPNPCQNEAICQEKGGKYMCFCVPGFQGHHCEIDINECASKPCQNNGTCLNLMDHYECQCATGYTGVNCETEIDECQSDPCQNGATCWDHVGYFSCECPAGYDGETCQHDIDECQSQPCLNGGVCQDAINSFYCNCMDTGFEGDTCEVDILECASNPCLNNATCLEGIKGYSCLCWAGYSGEFCEMDIDECAENPCLNDGLCLEQSNKTFYGTEPEFDTEFRYHNAAGYVCRCQPGFSGENCSTNINECESDPCQNGGACIDEINGFRCQCALGYTGVLCSVNIDDCEMMPCQNGATCQDGIADYACSCPAPLPGGITWGGKNCSVVLEGCLNHSCQNEAKCVPKYEQEVHSYTCQCQPGFHGEDCSIPTTFSFTSTGYILYDTDISNTTDKSIKESPIHITVRFRTTLANMVLLYQGDEDSYLILEMYNGFLQIGFRNNKTSHVIKADHKVDDGHWYKAEVTLKSSLELILHHDGCDNGICKTTQTLDDRDESHKFLAPVYIGGLTQDSMMNNTMSKRNFTGCMEDLTINSRTLIPQNINHDESFDMVLGCNKTNWCQPNPCHHQSACVDQWTSFKCDCSRPYKGPTCLQEYHSGTFFHEGVHSFGIFSITQDIGSSFILSAFIRTLKQDGLLLRISNNETNKLAVYLKSGHIHVTVMSSKPVSFSENISNGKKNMVSLEFRGGLVTAYNDQSMEAPHEVPSVSIEAQDTVLVGGLPPWENIEQWGGFFKGCLQDVRIDDKRLEFFTLDAEDDALYLGSVSKVIKDCVSDDTCKSLPCKNDGVCDVTWNEFTCACSANFTGPTCEEPVWCQRRPCPEDSTCHDIPGGYTCLYNATFNEDSSVVFTPSNISSDVQLTSVILNFRTRDTNAFLLQASKHLDHISIFIKDGKLVVLIQSGNSVEHVNFEGQIHVSDALWHKVAITKKDSTHVLPQWMISFDDGDNITLQGNAASLSFLLEDTPIVLAGNYTGCLGEVSIGGLYLPFADQKFPQKFMKKGLDLPVLGCKGADVCSGTPCLNSGQCVDQFNQFNCACAAGWEGQHCETNIDDCKTKPCINGLCVDLVADYRCDCHSGYTDRDCETNVDDCQGHQCLNGGTCLDGVDSYKCHCPANFTGEFCQWPYPPERCGEQVICLNGGKCNGGIWGANCTCRPGFKGSRCEMNIDECESNPCLNGGTCQDSVNNFKCICNSSFTGVRCEKNNAASAFPFSLLGVAVPVSCGVILLFIILVIFMVLTARKRRQSEGTYSPSQQEVAGARLEMDSVLKVPPEERLI